MRTAAAAVKFNDARDITRAALRRVASIVHHVAGEPLAIGDRAVVDAEVAAYAGLILRAGAERRIWRLAGRRYLSQNRCLQEQQHDKQ